MSTHPRRTLAQRIAANRAEYARLQHRTQSEARRADAHKKILTAAAALKFCPTLTPEQNAALAFEFERDASPEIRAQKEQRGAALLAG